ncbi:TNC, partial [Symbiodinium sp. KB8]
MAECPNGCSGHGVSDAAVCAALVPPAFPFPLKRVYTRQHRPGGSVRKLHACRAPQRVCPYGLSFVDTPLGDLNHDGELKAATSVLTQASNANLKELWQGTEAQEAHFYAECSNKGFCDRALGQCACFDGYTGSACQRTTCPNDCSGHGQCYTLREIAAGPNVEKTHDGSAVGRNFRIEDYQYGTYMTSGVSEAFDYNLWDADKNQACVCDAGYFGPDCA